MIRNALIIFALSSALMACGGGDGNDPRIDAKRAAIDDAVTAQAAVYCECYMEYGDTSQAECEASWAEPGDPTVSACLADAFNLDVDASLTYLECTLQATLDVNTCGTNTLDCADLSTLDVCLDAYITALGACTLPGNVTSALEACRM